MKVAIVNYNAGNTKSVFFALQRLNCTAVVTNNFSEIKNADKVILPGVGHAKFAMDELKKHDLHTQIPKLTQPVLGICLGLQLMCMHTTEGNVEGMGIFNTTIQKFNSTENKIPQIGWNNVETTNCLLLKNKPTTNYGYFVHSYYAAICSQTVGVTNYILPFSSILQKDNFYACQFHPEKSAAFGETILKNFIDL